MAASPHPALGERPHDPALDGVRGLAILLVLLHHCTVMRGVNAFDLDVATAMHLGGVGVDLFFVLSGYLITGILFDAKGRTHYFRNFYARRALRIFPLYYLVVFTALVIVPRIDHPAIAPKLANFGRISGDEWAYWVYLSNWTIAAAGRFRHAILDISWSLAIEEQFYLIWPWVVLFTHRRTLMRVALALAAAAFAVRVGLTAFGVNPIAVYVLTPCRMDTLALGAWLALAVRGPEGPAALDRVAPAARLLIAPAMLGAFAIALVEEVRRAKLPEAPPAPILSQTVGWTLWAVGFAAMLALVIRAAPAGRWRRLWSSPLLRTFGKYSYAMYLLHLPLRAIVRDLFFGPVGTGARFKFFLVAGSELPAQLLFFAICIPLTLAAGWVSWNLWERWFLALKRFVPVGTR